VTEYLILFAIVLGVNLLPAFGPPTWAILVLYGLRSDLAPVPMILTAAVAAALGRLLPSACSRCRRCPRRNCSRRRG
jgi:hypothetical protein